MSLVGRLAFPLLRRIDAESAHNLTITGLKLGLGGLAAGPDDPVLKTRLFGIEIPNPLGLAAGFDKNAEVPDAMLKQGFGFVEIGTVTPLPQPGNPRPRLFRLPEDGAVINRFGFNSEGMEAVAARLAARAGRPGLVGVNLGANKDSADRAADFVTGLERLGGYAGYVVVNVSSPNTPGLRALQGREELDALLGRLFTARDRLKRAVPLVLKIAPDLVEADREAIAEVALARGLDGLIVSNTTIARSSGLASRHAGEAGGLSGRPLMAPSTALLRDMHRLTQGRITLIGTGGITSGADAFAKLRFGATAVQLYSALALKGPALIPRIKAELAGLLRAGRPTPPSDWGAPNR
jgi:dihydroorotate dehydrogenase